MKKLIDFLSDKKILIGIGIGMVLTAILMAGVNTTSSMTNSQIEQKARGLGMDYPSEFKVINKDVSK